MRKFIFSLLFLLCFTGWAYSGKVVNKIVAVVGDEFLTLYELDQMAEPFYQKFIKPEMDPLEAEAVKNRIRKELLDQWIEDTVIGLEAKKYKISVSEEELEHFLKENEKKFNGTQENVDELKKKLKDQLVKIKFVQLSVRDKIAIPEAELKKAYEEYIKNYDPTPKYELEILIIKEELLSKELFEEALKGRALKSLNEEHREQTTYIREIFKEDELDKSILSALKDLKEGELLPLQKRGEVYQIIRLVKKSRGTPPSFEEVKGELYEKLFQKKAQEYLEKWIKELKESKFVKVYL